MHYGTSKTIVLDISQSKHVVVDINQYDTNTRELFINIANDGKQFEIPDHVRVLLKYDKPDKYDVLNECEIIDSNTVRIVFTDQMTMCAGRAKAQLMLIDYETNQVLHTMQFIVNVRESVIEGETATSSDEFQALIDATVDCYAAIDGAIATKKEMKELMESVNHEQYTNDSTPPTGQKTGDYWTRLL